MSLRDGAVKALTLALTGGPRPDHVEENARYEATVCLDALCDYLTEHAPTRDVPDLLWLLRESPNA